MRKSGSAKRKIGSKSVAPQEAFQSAMSHPAVVKIIAKRKIGDHAELGSKMAAVTRQPLLKVIDSAALAFAFPRDVDPLHLPVGSNVLVQLRRQKMTVGSGRIIAAGETRDINRDNEQVARVVALGPLAYLNRDTMQPWPEGAWCGIGDFVRVPKYGKEMWRVKLPDEDEPVVFNLVRDTDIIARITDPLAVESYVL